MKFIGIFLCLLALSIPTDAAKKKLLKKLAKELGYKLEDAIFKNIGNTVNDNKNDLDNVQTSIDDNADNIESIYVNSQLGCPVATDDHYEIIENMCFYFKDDFGVHDFASAQTACESKFPYGSGQLFEPKSLSHLQQVRETIQRRGMNCFYLGIDDSANEDSYVYTSDNSHLVSTIESTIVVTNGCGPQKECDHLYTCDHYPQISTIWSDYPFVDLVCVNIRIPEDCPVSTDDRYEIIQNRCYYFEDVGGYDFNTAQSTCGAAFVNGPGRVYEPTSLSNLQQVSAAVSKRGMGSYYLGIDDLVNEGTYLYTSDNSHVDSGVKSKIIVTNGCQDANGQNGNVDCDHLYGSNEGVIYTIWPHYVWADLVCENVNTISGTVRFPAIIWFDAYRNGNAVEANNIWTTITYTGLRESGDSGMNDVTGVFTAPLAGTYEFHYEAVKDVGVMGEMRLAQDGIQRSYVFSDDTAHWNSLSGTAILVLQAGNKVWVDTSKTLSGSDIHFTGTMVAT